MVKCKVKQTMNDSISLRPMPFWSWNDKLNKRELFRQIDEMKAQGYGGFFIHSRVGLVTEYLSDEWMDCVRASVLYAKEQGLSAWIYDEDMWPSGYAGGRVVNEHPEYCHKAFVAVKKEEILPNDIFLKNIAENLCIVIREAPKRLERFNYSTYIDAMNPDATRFFLKTTHERYKEYVGDLFGNGIEGFFTDEPGYYTFYFYENPNIAYSPYLRERIFNKYGYDILSCVEALFVETEQSSKIRREYYQAASEQFLEGFMKPYSEWCHQNNLKLTGHFACEDSLKEQIMFQGSVMSGYTYFDIPGVDKIMRPLTHITTMKQLTSFADIFQKVALCECFAGIGQESGFVKRKQIVDWLACLGISAFNPHLTPYSLRGERKRDYPPAISWHQPWWGNEHLFSTYIENLAYFTRCSKSEQRVLILEPLSTVAALYSPLGSHEMIDGIDERFSDLLNSLFEKHIDFHIIDENLFEEFACIRDGRLVVHGHEYHSIILPDCLFLSEKIKKMLLNTSSSLYAVGKCATEFTPNAISIGDLPQRLSKDSELYSLGIAEETKGIFAKHGKVDGGEYLFVSNSNLAEEQKVTFNCVAEQIQVIELTTGTRFVLPNVMQEITLQAGGSVLLYSGDEKFVEIFNKVDFVARTADGAYLQELQVCGKASGEIIYLYENALPLNRVEFTADNKKETLPITSIWHERFYPLKEGTHFEAVYEFNIETVPCGKIFAVLENAENLEEILLNGVPISPERQKGMPQEKDNTCWVDVSFTKVDISKNICLGNNRLLIRGKKENNIIGVNKHRGTNSKHNATEVETAYIVGDFGLKKGTSGYVIVAERGDAEMNPFYSGKISVRTRIDLTDCDFIGIENGNFAAVECVIDGRKCFESFINPAWIDVQHQKGEVDVEFVFTNTLHALLGPHNIKGYEDEAWIRPRTFVLTQLFGEEKPNLFHVGDLVLYKRK